LLDLFLKKVRGILIQINEDDTGGLKIVRESVRENIKILVEETN
jgi:hypothetical protein